MSDGGETDGICPFEKTCPHGCPCPFYECESVDAREITFGWYYNETDPLFKLKRNTPITRDPEYDRPCEYYPIEPNYHHLSRLVSFDMKSMSSVKVYERFILVSFYFYPDVSFLINKPKNKIVSSKSYKFHFP